MHHDLDTYKSKVKMLNDVVDKLRPKKIDITKEINEKE